MSTLPCVTAPTARTVAALLLPAAAAAALGLLVYLTARDPAAAVLQPAWARWPVTLPWGSVAGWLPEAVHPFVFALATAALWPRHRGPGLTAAAGWTTLDLAAEAAQHPAFAPVWAAGPLAGTLPARFALRGTFDPADLAAAAAGGLLAVAWILTVVRRPHPGGTDA